MERAAAPTPRNDEVTFRDGIGERRYVTDPNGQDSREILSIRGELSAVPAFEFALRERVARLASFRHAYYAHIRSVERLNDAESTLALVSDRVDGVRLSDLFSRAAVRGLNLDINAALCLIRQLVPAMAKLHESSRDVAHAAVGPERLIITPHARLVITEYALGSALEQLRYSQERYWKDLRIALPRSAGLPHFDQRADVTQIGVVALSLILGRLLRQDEYPSRVGEVVASAWAVSPRGGFEPLPPGIRGWVARALQLDARNSFANAVEASAELEEVLADSEYIGLPASLESFLKRYDDTHANASPFGDFKAEPAAPAARPAPVAPAAPAVTSSLLDDFISEVSGPAPADALQALAASVSVPKTSPTPAPPIKFVRPAAPAAAVPMPRPLPNPDVQVRVAADTPAAAAQARPIDSLTPPEPLRDMFGDAEAPARSRSGAIVWAAAVIAVVAVAALLGRMWWPTPAAPVATMGTLDITTNPPGATAVIDGKPSGTTPVTLSLIAGSHTLELRGVGEPRSLPVTITAGAQLSQYIELPKAAPVVGQLSVRTEPAGATVTIDGVRRGTTPMVVDELEPGDHSVSLDSDTGSVKQNVTIESGVLASLVVPMAAAAVPASGWLSLQAPIELQVREGDRVLGTSLTDRIMVPAGRHDLDLVNEGLGFRATRTVQVAAGKVAALKVDVPKGSVALNAIPWADVWIDGERVGETPMGNLSVAIGVHDVVLRHPELGEQHHQITVSLKGVSRLSVDLRRQ
jgi:hypothetical protein